jgi:hypothetical protein
LDPIDLHVGSATSVGYDRRVILASFLVGLAASIAALVLVVVRAVDVWRQAKRAGGAFAAELELFEDRAARTERLLDEAESSSRKLEEAVARLRVSLTRLQVLRSALERATARTRWLRAFLPV